jgi:gamma-butyrobetaine dioxygenase
MSLPTTTFSFSDGQEMTLPSLWLRDNCMCAECKVVSTQEKQFQCASVDLNIKPTSINVEEDIVKLTWPDDHKSEYKGCDLRAFAESPIAGEGYGIMMNPPIIEEAKPWPEDFLPLKISMTSLLHEPEDTVTALTELMRHGVFIIKDAGSHMNTLEQLAPVFGPMHEVLFERVHNVELKPPKTMDVDEGEEIPVYNIAHTGLAVPPHNDFASYTWNPSVQCLHMLVNEAAGGESCVVDGWVALRQMQQNHPDLFDVLRRFKVPFREFDEENETYTEQPIIRCDIQTGAITGLRYSNQLMQAINPLHPEAALFYKAYHTLSQLIMGSSSANNAKMSDRRSFRLSSGEVIVVAAHRVLHARSFIQPTGHRHLQDAYFCHDNLRNKLTLLLRQRDTKRKLPVDVNTKSTGPKFRSLAESSKKECDVMTAKYNKFCTPKHLAQRAIAMLEAQNKKETMLGSRVTLYEHGLQTATRAHRAGADEETVVCGLLHDVGELISPSSHGDVIAGILQPYISPRNQWVLRMHEVFQGYHYFEHIGANRNKRDEWKNHEFYNDCVTFCDHWDQTSFDDSYDSLPLEFFRPMVERVFSKEAYWWDRTHPKAVAVLGGVAGKDLPLNQDTLICIYF